MGQPRWDPLSMACYQNRPARIRSSNRALAASNRRRNSLRAGPYPHCPLLRAEATRAARRPPPRARPRLAISAAASVGASVGRP